MQNKESKFAETPGVQFHSDAIKGHANVKAHKDALSAEYMQRVSSIYQQHREEVLYKGGAYKKAFACAYFPTSFPGSLIFPKRDPGLGWSRVFQILADYK